ncbi:hypothetical protein IB223_14365 [Pseudoxanthomonas sp. PXM03]|uniref:hypothetical protein n=1 Tax=Pseudoxanthomonas sp. PXM03 TaxID=2769284 RepID=UPI0017809317|nr:hypothetical protein [Pseudoxanthomonas sp. PXM03]MBD9437284.1 hypothetical protein [Pseudoxanthomonas sp. PXM03]
MDRLSSTSALIAALRGDMLRKTEKRPASSPTSRTSQADKGTPTAAKSPAKLRAQLVDIAREVDLTDPASIQNSRVRLVRAVLLWEYGEAFREHPDWKPLMDHIIGTFEVDDAQNQRYMDLLSALKSSKHK